VGPARFCVEETLRSAGRMCVELKYAVSLAVLGFATGSWGPGTMAQGKPAPADLLAELQSEKTADQAGEQLRRLARSDAAVRQYLVVNLPPMIEAGPKSHLPAWRNAVQMAGDLKMVEAAPALAKWLGVDTGPPVGDMHQEARLGRSWPGKALFQIGDPAVPFVQAVLAQGTSRERWTAVYVLNKIGSDRARAAMREHLPDESDETLRSFIQKVVAK
jgi:hypothetical protein